MRNRKVYLTLALALTLAACAKKISAPHPGSLDNFDSQTYDALTVAQGVLDQAKLEFSQGSLPQEAKVVINRAGEAYNVARDAWLEYRAVKQAGQGQAQTDAIAAKVTAALTDLNTLISDLKTIMGGSQ